MEKEGFSIQEMREEVRKKGKKKNSVGKAKISKKYFFKKIEVCALAQSCRVLGRLLFLLFFSGSQPVKSGCGVSGPIFDPDVFVSGAFFVDGRSTLPGFEN